MSAAPVYNRTSSFTNLQALNPTGQPPGSNLDIEFNNAKTTLDALRTNAALIQNDDGTLANASVGLDQLSTEVTIGFAVPTAWATATAYVSSPASTVFQSGKFYSCLASHTSGVFATDLAAVKWVLIADFTTIAIGTAAQVAVTASGLLTTNVQTSLEALDSGKAAASHTHTASATSDSTAAGRAMLTAADVTAQQTLLGLGSLAYLSSVAVTDITGNIALTGDISPAAINSNTNDWAPTGWATSSRVRCSASSAINITGMLATTDGDIKIIHNVGGTNAITFTDQDASSSVANRIALGGGLTTFAMKANESLCFIYDGTTARWRLMGRQRPEFATDHATAFPVSLAAVQATQANQETGTSNTTVVSPSVQQFHPSAAKMWGYVTGGGTPVLSANYNITSITDTATGRLTVTIGTDFSSANWCCPAQTMTASGGSASSANIAESSQAAGSVEIKSVRGSDGVLTDPIAWYFSGFGDQ